MAWWFGIKLWKRVFLGLVLGVIFGLAVSQTMEAAAAEALLEKVRVIGTVFIRLIRMIVVPLVFFTLVAGIYAMGDPKKLGTIGIKAFVLYIFTTFFANLIGLGMGTLFQPGKGVDLGGAEPRQMGEAQPIGERLLGIIPENPFAALVEGDMLAVIFFALLLGVGLLMAREAGQAAGRFFEAGAEGILQMTHIIMELAPFGVFGLIAYVAGTQGVATFTAILSLTLAVYLGCALHMLFVYGGLVRIILRLPFVDFFRGILDPMMVAYSTSSSSATLPVTIRAATENLGIKKSVAGSVLPLGATINMDGTSLYLGIVALFTAQAFGYSLEPQHYFLIALTAALVSIGTAGVPSASLFLLAIVLEVFDVTPEHTALVIGFIFPFDRLLDMMRTVTNVTGDTAVATAVAKWEGELDEDVFRQKPLS
ncbi:MAG: dicarboxylate/amino acid:cation symporter [Parvularcula sp.]|uniref:dicarboxylate/amino acid:cation symporter n=2 Tax=Hyphococcus sp. TaxID=2038636 RepID=UPI000C45B881|nr:dicarboxylate/amino acid:cation symporter [Parvularcula sp.]